MGVQGSREQLAQHGRSGRGLGAGGERPLEPVVVMVRELVETLVQSQKRHPVRREDTTIRR